MCPKYVRKPHMETLQAGPFLLKKRGTRQMVLTNRIKNVFAQELQPLDGNIYRRS
jgi:hypothetical protein